MNAKIKRITDKICEGDFSSSDVGLLFVLLRPHLSWQKDPILLDLANFVTHSEGRDQGESHGHIQSYVRNFIQVSKNGGTISGLLPVFKKGDVIQLLIEALRPLDLNIGEDGLRLQKDSIADCLCELMEEVEIKLSDPEVVRCFLRRDAGKVMFCLNLDLKGPRIIMPPGATIQSDLFV